MFDPASFFGHSEFELAIMDMFGGFEEPFWAAYHAKVRACAQAAAKVLFATERTRRRTNDTIPSLSDRAKHVKRFQLRS